MKNIITNNDEKELYNQYREEMKFVSSEDFISFDDWKLIKSGETITEINSSNILLK